MGGHAGGLLRRYPHRPVSIAHAGKAVSTLEEVEAGPGDDAT